MSHLTFSLRRKEWTKSILYFYFFIYFLSQQVPVLTIAPSLNLCAMQLMESVQSSDLYVKKEVGLLEPAEVLQTSSSDRASSSVSDASSDEADAGLSPRVAQSGSGSAKRRADETSPFPFSKKERLLRSLTTPPDEKADRLPRPDCGASVSEVGKTQSSGRKRSLREAIDYLGAGKFQQLSEQGKVSTKRIQVPFLPEADLPAPSAGCTWLLVDEQGKVILKTSANYDSVSVFWTWKCAAALFIILLTEAW